MRIAARGVFTTWLVETSFDWLYDIPGLTGMALVAAALLLIPAPQASESANERDAAGGRRCRMAGAWAEPLTRGLMVTALAVVAVSVGRQYLATRYGNSGSGQIVSAPDQALARLHTAYELDPENVQTLFWIADSYEQLHDYADARTVLLSAQSREPSNYVPPALLGELAARGAERARAVADFRRSLVLNPIDPQISEQLSHLRRA